jgi:DNA-binding NtrC family response regulator
MMKFVALIVEDDPFQRMFVADLLKDEGLQVVECASANLAGDVSGVELAQCAKRRFPDMNVVMVSGRGAPYIPHNTHFLMKPYLPEQLLAAVLK